jgi:arginine/lysine/ornithine decarboxylase
MAGLSLNELLNAYALSGAYPMHMPGHKRNDLLLGTELPYKLDITEIPGFDNLQSPEGVLKSTAELAARLYGAERAYLSVNGSTGALLAAVKACARPYDEVIMARNCHKSVYSAMEIGLLKPTYILPDIDPDTGIACGVEPAQVREALEANPGAKLVIVTSPTYEGVLSDIRGIAAAAHERGVPLLVDSAHGAHLGFSPFFGESSVQAGADLTVVSLHKTLPALTQSALLLSRGGLADEAALHNAVNAFQTSSPSYVLLASIDACLRLLETQGGRLFADYERRLRKFREKMRRLRRLSLYGLGGEGPRPNFGLDPGKLAIATNSADITGPELAGLLRDNYKIETEMAAPEYALAMTSLCDTDEGFELLSEALLEIDAGLKEGAGAPR